MNFISPGQSWEYQLGHYEALERSDMGWDHIAAYRNLVERIAGSPFAERLFALRSLDYLVISPTPGWVKKGPKWVDRSLIILRPCRDERVSLTFIKKRKGRPEEAVSIECLFDEAWQVLEPWLQELLREAIGPTPPPHHPPTS